MNIDTKLTKEKACHESATPFFITPSGERIPWPMALEWAQPATKWAISAADRYRLVKGAKCPTKEKQEKDGKKRFDQSTAIMNNDQANSTLPVSEKFGRVGAIVDQYNYPPYLEIDGSKFELADCVKTGELIPHYDRQRVEGPGRFTVISRREWSGEYRIRTQVDLPHATPPAQSGKRITSTLSMRGAVTIADSCHYMAVKHGGYSTFLTLTFNDEARARIASGQNTIQHESRRFFDSIQKMYQRGWRAKTDLGTVKISGHDEKLKYCWVAENPKNAASEDNPHLHVLLSWQVPFNIFEAWANRIEKIWGQGFAHLEKIKEPMKAGAYMAKAAGYLTKAAGECEQGEIRGNRYSVSEDARAPEWECICRAELGIMGHIITDVHDYFSFKYGHVFEERRNLNTKLSKIKAEHAAIKAVKGTVSKESIRTRCKVGQKLQTVRAKLSALPAIASKYQLTIKSTDRFNAFLQWAIHGNRNQEQDWLPEINRSETWDPNNKPDGLWLGEFKRRLNYRRHRLWEKTAEWWESLCTTYDQYPAPEPYDQSSEYDEWARYANHWEFCQ